MNTTATRASPVGSYPIRAAQGTLASAHYSFTFQDGTLTVTPALLTVTSDDATRAYGSANPVFTGTITGIQNGNNITANYSTTATAASPPGTYAITAGLGTLASGHYSFSFQDGTLTVTKAPLTITAENKSRLINQANPTLTYTLNGFVNGETQSSSGVTGSPNLATAATETSPRGTYRITIVAGTLASERYSFQLQEGTLTVLDPPVIVVQPAERILAVVEQNVELSVSASGAASLNYQWWRDGSIMANATNLTLLITNAAVQFLDSTATDFSGRFYRVIVAP